MQCDSARSMPRSSVVICLLALSLGICSASASLCLSGETNPRWDEAPRKLLRAGDRLAENTRYLEALDLLEEAKMILEKTGRKESRDYADVLYAMAKTKIKGRIHQSFAASYVKSALIDIRASNSLRERLSKTLPQELAHGYYLEGVIHKKFFRRTDQSLKLFKKAVDVDPGNVAAKRALSALVEE